MKNPGQKLNRKFECDTSAMVLPAIAMLLLFTACGKTHDETASIDKAHSNTSGSRSTAIDAAPVIEKYRALDDSRDSTIKLRAAINSSDSSGLDAPRQITFNMYRKRYPDGRQQMLIEFTSPPEERDRDGLITVFPDAQVEGVRYVQSTDSYITTRDLSGEDALFGLTLQELADGQPERYDFTIEREESVEGTECYRAEGKLKPGSESKFPRLVLFISKQNNSVVKAEFYDKSNQIARDLVVRKAEMNSGHWTRVQWTINNVARRKKIEFEALDVGYDQNLKDSIFTREYLKKIASR